jgi:hypothetical protein
MKRLTLFIPTLLAALLLAWVQSLAQSAQTPRNRLGAAEQAQTAVLYVGCSTVTPMGSAQPTATVTILPTRGTSPTPTPIVTLPMGNTPLPSTPAACIWGNEATKVSGSYRYTDPVDSGFLQNVRSGPALTYPALRRIPKSASTWYGVYWRIVGTTHVWLSIANDCTEWLALCIPDNAGECRPGTYLGEFITP